MHWISVRFYEIADNRAGGQLHLPAHLPVLGGGGTVA